MIVVEVTYNQLIFGVCAAFVASLILSHFLFFGGGD